ncbi:hypothetical protein [Acetobacter sp.]|uniref:hypothetical protein n=1 Tax=Acetobacter sp. TaxID=440 RepID=UPI0039E87CFF
MGLYDFFSVILALSAVLAMILLSKNGWQFAAKLSGKQNNAGLLSVEATLALDAKRRLNVVCWEGRRILLLTGGSTDIVVDRLTSDDIIREST